MMTFGTFTCTYESKQGECDEYTDENFTGDVVFATVIPARRYEDAASTFAEYHERGITSISRRPVDTIAAFGVVYLKTS